MNLKLIRLSNSGRTLLGKRFITFDQLTNSTYTSFGSYEAQMHLENYIVYLFQRSAVLTNTNPY